MKLTGPPEDAGDLKRTGPVDPYPKLVSISEEELRVLRAILSRDYTAAVSHGGLKGLLTLTDGEVLTFTRLVNRIELFP